jgi:hypothetical protein
MNTEPVFVHSLWRTGSTYLWQAFRRSGACCAYYEPFHENLALAMQPSAGNPTMSPQLRHPEIGEPYFAEYPLTESRMVPGYQSRFAFQAYCTDAAAEDREQQAYIQTLIDHAGERRPTFHFCRSALRIGWLKRRFAGVHLYMVRSPRDQWQSYRSFQDRYFMAATLLIVALHRHSVFRPLAGLLCGLRFQDSNPYTQLQRCRKFLRSLRKDQQYLVFCAVWQAAVSAARQEGCEILDMNAISENASERDRVMRLLAASGLTIDLSDCALPRYATHSLAESEMKDIEAYVGHGFIEQGGV